MIDRTKPPETAGLPAFKLPPVFETQLSNGLSILLVEDRRFPLVTLRLGFDAGSKFDPPELAGLSESTGALLTEGTARRTAQLIAEEAAGIGGALRADSSADSLIVAGHALAENLPRLLDLVADVTQNATFPEDEVELRKQNRKQELLAQRSDAGFLADEKFAEVIFTPHPYARQDPTLESIDRFERQALAAFRDRHVAPESGVLVLLGALPPRGETIELLGRHFGEWRSHTRAPVHPAAPPHRPERIISLVNRPGSVQADIRMGRVSITRRDPDYFPLLVGNTILGGGTSSRVFMHIREEQGFAYDARTMIQPLKEYGSFAAVTQVRNEVLQPALEALEREMRSMMDQEASADEIATAKNYLSGIFVIRLETQDGLASQLLATRLLGLPLSYLENYTRSVRGVTPDAIRAAAGRHFDPDAASIVVVGDSAEIQNQLEVFGAVGVEEAK